MVAIKKNFHRIIIESDSQVVVNIIDDKLYVPRDIINFVVRNICTTVKEVTYCASERNTGVDRVMKSIHKRLL